jgi:hypothetical protein
MHYVRATLGHIRYSPKRPAAHHITVFATQYALCGALHKLYSNDSRDFSLAQTLEDFLRRYG